MKRIVLMSLVSLYGASVYGMHSLFVPSAELNEFIKNGDAAQMVNDLGSDDALDELKAWAGVALQEFGAHHVDSITVLHKFSEMDEPENAILDFLLDDCKSDPDFGAEGKTPRDLAELRHQNDLIERFNKATRARFVELYATWEQKKVTTDAVAAFFAQHPAAKVDIDALSTGWDSVSESLEANGSIDALRILAYAAPYRKNKIAALKSLIVGRVECDLPRELLVTFLDTNGAMEFDNAHIDKLFLQGGLEKYCEEKFAINECKDRVEEVSSLLEAYSYKQPANARRHTLFWLNEDFGDVEDEDLSLLLYHCAQDAARMDELKAYLGSRKELLTDVQYDEKRTIADLFGSLDAAEIPHKDEVVREISEHNNRIREVHARTCHDLLDEAIVEDSKVQMFVEYIAKNSLDIDEVIYQNNQTIGEFLADRLPHLTGTKAEERIRTISAAVQRYRSNPPEVDALRTLVREVLERTITFSTLTDFLKGKCFNIDRIAYEPAISNRTIGEMLDAERPVNVWDRTGKKERVARILALEDIQKFRSISPTNDELLSRYFADALDRNDAYEVLEKFYQAHTVDVDKYYGMVGMVSIGDLLNEMPLKANALRIAKLVQPDRTNKQDMLRVLIKEYEIKNDAAKLADLKEWVTLFPLDCDIDTITYDLAQPVADTNTLGHIVNLRNEAALSELFKTVRSKVPAVIIPPKPIPVDDPDTLKKPKSWMTGKNIAIALGSGVVSYLLYKRLARQENDQNQGQPIARAQEVF